MCATTATISPWSSPRMRYPPCRASAHWWWNTRSCPSCWTCRRPWSRARPSCTRAIPTTSSSTPTSARATIRPPFRSRGSSRWRAGTTPPPCSTPILRTTAASPTRRTAVSWWCPPPRSPISSAGSWDRRWVAPGRIFRSSSPTSAAASATSRTPCMSRCAPGAARRWAAAASAWTAPARRRSSPTACATPSASTSSHGSTRTAPSPPARWSASPTRALTPPTVTPSWPRPWAPSRRSIPATTSRVTRGRCIPTAPRPVPCAAMACPRPPLPTTPTLTSAPRPWAWIRWSTA